MREFGLDLSVGPWSLQFVHICLVPPNSGRYAVWLRLSAMRCLAWPSAEPRLGAIRTKIIFVSLKTRLHFVPEAKVQQACSPPHRSPILATSGTVSMPSLGSRHMTRNRRTPKYKGGANIAPFIYMTGRWDDKRPRPSGTTKATSVWDDKGHVRLERQRPHPSGTTKATSVWLPLFIDPKRPLPVRVVRSAGGGLAGG
jgi:hypothetical protein